MSKIYRLHSGAKDTVQDWTQIDSYLDSSAIDLIPDNAGADATKQITSIPSPFARIDLVKTAFKNVVASGKPEGITIFHRMVSDTLDVGQVFFNSINPTSKVEIIAWNPGLSWIGDKMIVEQDSDLGQLIHSDQPSHRLYGETLQMFFEQDFEEYNFKSLNQFYLLDYKDGPGRYNIIGGTSPTTLFFSSANPLQYVDLNFKNDKLFDDVYCPLQERSEDYILFLYSLRIAMPDFRTRFKVVDNYLEMCVPYLEEATKRKVLALDRNSYTQHYTHIPLAGEGNHPEIAGFELRGVKIDAAKPERESDFVIAATHHNEGLLPLVLPAYTFNGALNYVDGKWSPQIKAPYYDPLPLEERILPGQGIKYPYLTTSDLLEPYLIQLPFEPNQDKFFNGYFPKGSNEGYLLPLSQTFFNYFTTEDLKKSFSDGRHMFEFEKLPGNAIKAKLRIPIKNGRFIDVERIYNADMAQQNHTDPDVANNRGIIRIQKFSLVIYPFVKSKTENQVEYTIMLLDQDISHTSVPYSLKYYKDRASQQPIDTKPQRQKSFKQQHAIDTMYDVVQADFDFITVQAGKAKGCLVPIFPQQRNSNLQYSFAIDFGTTNTHIEYRIGDGQPQPFDITAEDPQLGMLHNWNSETYSNLTAGKFGKGATLLLENVPKEMMPEQIGGQSKYKFPRRTVMSEPVGIDINRDTYPFADFSIYWQYDMGVKAKQLQAHTNLKWSSLNASTNMGKRMEGYIGTLVQLIRNKVVLNGGNLSQTKIIWFYPTSMLKGRLQHIENIWNKQVEKYMGLGIEPVNFPESVAPFYYFQKYDGVMTVEAPAINIDIGGGTTDIVVYKNKNIDSYTSFKFAGNALFGDAYNKPSSQNGFVQFFEKQCRDVLNNTILSQFLPAKDGTDSSEEFITAVFGLQYHPEKGEVSFSFTEQLRETEELKIVPLLFISSIFYHVAKYQKHRDGAIPRYITFSGTASKLLQILDVSKKLKSITRLVNHIFNDVFGCENAEVELVVTSGPKEVTAKGGLCDPAPLTKEKFVLFGSEDTLGYRELTYAEAQQESTRKAVITEVEIFIDLFFKWNSQLDFTNDFAMNARRFNIFKKKLKADLNRFLEVGIQELQEEMDREEDSKMNETLFFMPLKGALNELAFFITDNNRANV